MATLDVRLAMKLLPTLEPGRPRYAVKVKRGLALKLDRHPDAPNPGDLAAVKRWVRSVGGPTAIDLFCGAGGLSLGLHNAGFKVLVGADHDAHAIETYAANLPGLSYHGDLTDPIELLQHLEAWGIRSVDLIAGGVPCQPFSRAGKSKIRSLVEARVRHGEDDRAMLWHSFVTVVRALRPRAVLLENVPDLVEWEEGAVLVGFCEALQELGYETDARVLKAYEHGVPQHRSRLFIVGIQAGLAFAWPRPRRSSPTVWDAIGDLPTVSGGQRQERLPYHGAKTRFQRRMRAGLRQEDRGWVHDHLTRDVRQDDLEAYRGLPEGGTYTDIPERLRRYRSDIFTDKYKRLSKGDLSRTITAHIARDGYWYIHPTEHRTISVREAARIQTFPDSFRFSGEPTLRYRQIGNAVPPHLGEAIGLAVASALTTKVNRSRPSTHTFRADLIAWHRNNNREYPWRSGDNPWLVLLAEMCLHRTRADQVSMIFAELMQLATSPQDLLANEKQVRTLLDSLGLRWRIDNILRTAGAIIEAHQGQVPSTREALLRLPGVGDYVANAVLCFGFRRPAILMDTNTERIVGRVMGHRPTGNRWQMRLDLYRLAGPRGADAEFNYGLLDLGAKVCRASSRLCSECPVARHCLSVSTGD